MITGKILKLAGWPEGRMIGLAKAAAEAMDPLDERREATLARLAGVRANPGAFLADPVLADLARECLRRAEEAAALSSDELRDAPLAYPTWGAEQIEPGALAQMDNALRLPVAVAGALMPDAHPGFGVPHAAVDLPAVADRPGSAARPLRAGAAGSDPLWDGRGVGARPAAGAPGAGGRGLGRHAAAGFAARQGRQAVGHQRLGQPLCGVRRVQAGRRRRAAGPGGGRVPGAALA